MEEESDFQDKIAGFAKKNWLILILLFAGFIFVGIGLTQMIGRKTAGVKFEKGEAVAEVEASSDSEIKVDVEGQVEKPGVYSLKGDARVQDALIAAGGLSASANRNALNLAAKVADGQKIYVPAIGEATSAVLSSSTSETEPSVAGLVSINNGSQSQLEELPSIGPVTAGKIIDGRPYASLEEVLSKKAVGKATYEKIKDLITL